MPERWARLHFVNNTDGTELSEPITGILTDETPSHFVLTHVLAYRETEHGMEAYTEGGMDFFNKVYVWHMEMLPDPPKIGLLTDVELSFD